MDRRARPIAVFSVLLSLLSIVLSLFVRSSHAPAVVGIALSAVCFIAYSIARKKLKNNVYRENAQRKKEAFIAILRKNGLPGATSEELAKF